MIDPFITAKPAAAFTESNVWQDPASTVRKTAQPDKGTAIWGDPHQQVVISSTRFTPVIQIANFFFFFSIIKGDIKRWKSNSDDATPGANMNVGSGQTSTPGAGGNGGQSAWPSGSTPAAGTSVKSTPSASGWDTTPGGGQSATTPSGSWNNPTGQGVKPNANGAGWPAEQGWGGNPKTVSAQLLSLLLSSVFSGNVLGVIMVMMVGLVMRA